MITLEMVACILGTVVIVALAAGLGNFLGKRSWKKKHNIVSQLLFDKTTEFALWQNAFDGKVDEEVKKRIKEWEPDFPTIQNDFARAERMADYMQKKRETINANRPHPQRPDSGGQPAKVTRIRVNRGRKPYLT